MAGKSQNTLTSAEYVATGKGLIEALLAASEEIRFAVLKSRDPREDSTSAEKKFLRNVKRNFTYKGKPAKVIDSKISIGWKKGSTRWWFDFTIYYEGNFYRYNFKNSAGKTADNVFSLKALGYLLGAPCDHPLKASPMNQMDVAELAADILAGRPPEDDGEPREYFCLFCEKNDRKEYRERFRTIAISQLKEITFNPTNGLQVRFLSADEVETPRTRGEVQKVFAAKVYDFYERRADPHRRMDEILGQAVIEDLQGERFRQSAAGELFLPA